MSSINLPALGSELGLSQYMKQIQAIPMLTDEEEYSLAKKWYEEGDIKAAQKLVLSHIRLVVKVAHKFKGYGLPMMDLISEGNIGLMKAVKKFDPDMGYKLATYAMWWIKATIQDYILKSWSILKVGTSALQKKLFFNLKKVRKNLTQSGSHENGNIQDAIADKLGVSVNQVKDMELNLSGDILSLQDKIYDGDGDDSDDLLSSISAAEDVEDTMLELHDKNIMLQKLTNAMTHLSERERDIIVARRLNDDAATLDSLSSIHGISRERVRQIEEKAMSKLKNFMLLDEQRVRIAN